MSPRTSLLLLTVVLAVATCGLATVLPAFATGRDTGVPARALDAATPRADAPPPVIQSPQPPGRGPIESRTVDDAPKPSTRVAVQEPAAPETEMPRKSAPANRTDPQPDPYLEALLEQSRAQTAALQQIAAQQRASEDARIIAHHSQTERAVQLNGARIAIDGAVQSLQAMGDWNANSLESTGASLRQTAAAASAAGSAVEASRAAEAARLVEAAKAALTQRNSQQAQYYLLEANELLFGAPNGRE
jgi:hypothetical protein